jgi:UDP-N-acetylmuramoylalanine--D-glutamate ligase
MKTPPPIFGNTLRRQLRKEWSGRRVTVMGLGQIRWGSGWSSAAFFASLGAKVTVTDQKSADSFTPALKALRPYPITYVFGKHRLQDFSTADLVIKNPIVSLRSPYLRAARRKKIPIETDVSWFVQHCSSRVIGVTGTRGKSTTATLIAHLLGGESKKIYLGGNVGRSPLRFLFQLRPDSLVVLELSSWMLESLSPHRWSPSVAVLTNVYRDHLNTYGSFAEYTSAKALITKFQRPGDLLVYNDDHPIVKRIARKTKAACLRFSLHHKAEVFAQKNTLYLQSGGTVRPMATTKDIQLLGQHNIANTLAALGAVSPFMTSKAFIRSRLRSFQGVPERLETIRVFRKRRFINDTTATSPDATIAALECFPKPLVLIAGGTDKELDFRLVARTILRRVSSLVLLPGSGTIRLQRELKRLGFRRSLGPVQSMPEAVSIAWNQSTPGSTILLSPGATSFGLFTNEFDRGRAFRTAVRALR